jgi:tRNA (guanine37-N1)-methyltransferase
VFSRPADFRGLTVPEVLLQGDPKKVDQWRSEQAMIRTKLRRPDILDKD